MPQRNVLLILSKPELFWQHFHLFLRQLHGKNGFVTATKLGTTNKIFVAATKRFVDRTKHFVLVTKCFCYPYFNK